MACKASNSRASLRRCVRSGVRHRYFDNRESSCFFLSEPAGYCTRLAIFLFTLQQQHRGTARVVKDRVRLQSNTSQGLLFAGGIVRSIPEDWFGSKDDGAQGWATSITVTRGGSDLSRFLFPYDLLASGGYSTFMLFARMWQPI